MVREKTVFTPKEWQEKIEEESPVKRDEVCRHCGKTFLAGEYCEGYMDWRIIGYSSVGIADGNERHGYFCNKCMEEFIYRFIGTPSLSDHERAPSKLYGSESLGQKKPKPKSMMIKGKVVKWNKKRFLQETKRFAGWVKKNEPWNKVDYYKFGGAR